MILTCPYCLKVSDSHSKMTTDETGNIDVEDEGITPSDADTCMCIYCGHWSVIEDGDMRRLTEAEADVLARNPFVIAATVAWKRAKAARN